jgi:alkylation response protein AidB-like acyl-CoA dehydrogenase
MADYRAPIQDIRFVLRELADLEGIARIPGFEEATPDLVDAVLEEAGKMAGEVLAPLNHSGDVEGCSLENGVVRTPKGFKQAYAQYVENGWNSVPFEPEFGGQGLPWVVAQAVQEMWNSANMAFALCPLLNVGAVELLQAHGSDEQKATYLPKMVSGEWTGTMNLTEPQAGSDVGAAKTRAVREGDHYRIKGQKIYITYGEHDLTDNIVHMVLARTPDAPEGTRGISLFIVPKYLPKEDGSPGERNDLRCVSIEHKLGINASPTCTMAFGDGDGAIGFLVGEENRGIEYMFTMMNNARLSVGIQGVAIAERAYQQALAYARERVQGRPVDGSGRDPVPIVRHPDVRRTLLTMRAQTEAARALAYVTTAALDRAKHHPDPAVRAEQQLNWLDLLTPVVKAWCTDLGCEVASLGVQVHGGMGFIEETGAAQHYRDARITPIYEGTNGIQAMDLIGRKVLRHGGAPMRALALEIKSSVETLSAAQGEDLPAMAGSLKKAVETLEQATDWLVEAQGRDAKEAAAGATPYLQMAGGIIGAWLLARSAEKAAARLRNGSEGEADFLHSKIHVARFYADNLLPRALASGISAIRGSRSVLTMGEDML